MLLSNEDIAELMALDMEGFRHLRDGAVDENDSQEEQEYNSWLETVDWPE